MFGTHFPSETTSGVIRRKGANHAHEEPSQGIVFCHGLWRTARGFSKVIPALQAEGHQVIAAQYGLNTTADDVATVRSTLARVSSPAILVGHSYGGASSPAPERTTALPGLVLYRRACSGRRRDISDTAV